MNFRHKAYNLIKAIWMLFVTAIVLIISGFVAATISSFAIDLIKVGYGYSLLGIALMIVDAIYVWFICLATIRFDWRFDDDSEHNSK